MIMNKSMTVGGRVRRGSDRNIFQVLNDIAAQVKNFEVIPVFTAAYLWGWRSIGAPGKQVALFGTRTARARRVNARNRSF